MGSALGWGENMPATEKGRSSRNLVRKGKGPDQLVYDQLGISPSISATVKRFLVVKKWIYRLGNSRSPDGSETVISLDGVSADIKATYIQFHPTCVPVPCPGFNAGVLHVHYRMDQLEQVKEVLSLIPKYKILLLYYEFDSGHRWAELQNDWVP